MPTLLFIPFTLGVTVSVFALGILAWRRNPHGKGAVLFALLSCCMAVWTLAEAMDGSLLWRIVFFLSIAFAPALAMHAATSINGRPFRLSGWLSYLFAAGLFLLQVLIHHPVTPLLTLLFSVAAVLLISSDLYPELHAMGNPGARRRATYGLVLLTTFLIAGLWRFITSPLEGVTMAFAMLFFFVASFSFARIRLFDVDIPPVESLFILTMSAGVAAVAAMRHSPFVILVVISLVIVGAFGMFALVAMRRESRTRAQQSEAFAVSAHQWLGSLSGIRAAAELFANGDCGSLSESGLRTADELKRCTQRLTAMMETALHGARLDLSSYQPMVESTNVVGEIRSMIGDLEPLARSKGIELSASFSDVPDQVTMDPRVLRTVVFNIIENAVKYTDNGCVTVTAQIHDGLCTIRVTDTGCGLAPHADTWLFERFRRGTHAARRASGSGLGLYVAKKMVEAVGGRVSADSPGLGKGATFTILLPVGQKS